MFAYFHHLVVACWLLLGGSGPCPRICKKHMYSWSTVRRGETNMTLERAFSLHKRRSKSVPTVKSGEEAEHHRDRLPRIGVCGIQS